MAFSGNSKISREANVSFYRGRRKSTQSLATQRFSGVPRRACWRPRPYAIGDLGRANQADQEMPEVPGLMRGKRGLIMGVANHRSLAWGIAKACHAHGAALAFTYQGDALKKRVEPLARDVGGILAGDCDVTEPKSIDAVFAAVGSAWGALDFLVHAIAFSDKDQLDGRYVDTTQENFNKTMLVSCYSFTSIVQRAEKMMPNGGALLTLTYYGAEKWMPHYNVMGVAKSALETSVRYLAADLGVKNIRVNAISSGPIKTLAASGIGDFRYILKWNEYNAPLRRNVTIEEVGEAGVYLLSDMSRGVTGEVHHVDAGYHIVGMKHPDAPDITVNHSADKD
jgi:enoyl-[acyl-carrier protein] reductase I